MKKNYLFLLCFILLGGFQLKAQLYTMTGPGLVCPGAEVQYTLAPIQILIWTCTAPGATINGMTPPVTLYAPFAETVTVKFGVAGGQVCAQSPPIDTAYPPKYCKNVIVQPLPPTILPTLTIYDIDLPFIWPIDNFSTADQIGTFNFSETLTSYLGCDSIVKQTIKVIQHPGYTISGTVFYDDNKNQVFDPGELPATGVLSVQSNGVVRLIQTVSGPYTISGVRNQEVLVLHTNDPSNEILPDSWIFSSNNLSGYDFAVQKTTPTQAPNWKISLDNQQIFRPGFNTSLRIRVESAFNPDPTQVRLVLNSKLAFVSASLAPDKVLNDTLFWNISPQPTGKQDIFVSLKTDIGVSIGSSIGLSATIGKVNGEISLNDNVSNISRVVMASWDPNMKEVSMTYLAAADLGKPSGELQYVIHFQNLGNYRADFVTIRDTLGEEFDLTTLKVISASHPFHWDLNREVLTFTFDSILLPPASADEAGSQGFVRFHIRTKTGLTPGSLVANRADIFFDYNPPVRTEKAETWVAFLPTAEQDRLYVSPNPAAQWLFVRWKQPAAQSGTIRLVDANGLPKIMQSIEAGAQSADLLVAGLPSGNYWVILDIAPRRYTKQVMLLDQSTFPGVRRH